MPDDSRSSTTAEPSPRPREGEGLLDRLRALFGLRSTSARDELAEALQSEDVTGSGFTPEEQALIRNILDLRERRVEDVMVPRADIVAAQKDVPLNELVQMFEQAGHSRLVVYDDTLDDPVGMVHIRDVLGYIVARATTRRPADAPFGELDLSRVDLSVTLAATRIVRRLLFVPPSMPLMALLAKMQATRIHLALVIDEYGGTDGLVSIEDLVEQVVGEIEDEHDETITPEIRREPDGALVADARAGLEDVVAVLGPEFVVGDVAEEVDTVGGLIVTLAGRVPVRGELVPGPAGYEFEILDADPRRVKRLRIREPRAPDAAIPAAETAGSAGRPAA